MSPRDWTSDAVFKRALDQWATRAPGDDYCPRRELAEDDSDEPYRAESMEGDEITLLARRVTR